jgi:hypothetical protein
MTDKRDSSPKVQFSRVQVEYLQRVFSEKAITPESSIESIMYDAGAKAVVALCVKHCRDDLRVRV